MKKVYSILFIIFLFYTKITAQSLSLQNLNNNLQDTAGFILMMGSVDVVNNNINTLDVMMYRKINNLAPGHTSMFCWGINCYPPQVDTSVYPVSMSSNTSSPAQADLMVYDSAGISEVTYCWYDLNNPADSVCLQFTYDVLPRLTGINELNVPVNFVSFPRPNPADLSAVLFYNLEKHDADTYIIVYNVMGSKVLEAKLDNSKHDVRLNTASFRAGVYYCSMVSGGKTISTRKLMVLHKN